MNRLTRLKLVANKSLLGCSNRYFSVEASRLQNGRLNKILIANRGEIACRIMRTAKKLGIKTVAVYSDADKHAMHVDLAEEAYYIGPAASTESYLRQDKIIAVAKRASCEAIHPGYGFLSENADFAELCENESIIFIGPPARAIRDMGIKSTSKIIMNNAGVPIIHGYHGDDQSTDTLFREAKKIGFPLMIKAVLGGGGKGMRIAWKEGEFLQALESARTESQKAFGNSAVLLEKYISEPRHIEVQVFADKHGNAVHLFERDCSVQRRHQKIIEEAPAPGISSELRAELGEAAVRAAKAVGYVGAGTVEFVMDRRTKSFHFMEMNTRLQVEHPITEAITSTDLVEWQLKVAAGDKLPMCQEDINLGGHAFEARVYAEDPRNNFLPAAGSLKYLSIPSTSNHVRVETGVRQNDEVSVHYDPMIAKLVVWGKDRNEALDVMRTKLSEYDIVGLETNLEFLKKIVSHSNFRAGDVHTNFIDEHYDTLFTTDNIPNDTLVQGVLGIILCDELNLSKSSTSSINQTSPFIKTSGRRLNHLFNRRLNVKVGSDTWTVEVKYLEPQVYLIRINDCEWRKVTGSLNHCNNIMYLTSVIDGVNTKTRVVAFGNELHLLGTKQWKLVLPEPVHLGQSANSSNAVAGAAVSPMPGVVEKILVKKGDNVNVGDPLLVIVAMKMEHVIKASSNGSIQEVLCKVGESVSKSKLLIKLSDVSRTE